MHGPMLALLTALFFLRVLGQALSVFLQVDWLPATEHWASGLIPYPILLTIQIVMLIVMVKISTDDFFLSHGRLTRDSSSPSALSTPEQ
jgi:hypothetical protein